MPEQKRGSKVTQLSRRLQSQRAKRSRTGEPPTIEEVQRRVEVLLLAMMSEHVPFDVVESTVSLSILSEAVDLENLQALPSTLRSMLAPSDASKAMRKAAAALAARMFRAPLYGSIEEDSAV